MTHYGQVQGHKNTWSRKACKLLNPKNATRTLQWNLEDGNLCSRKGHRQTLFGKAKYTWSGLNVDLLKKGRMDLKGMYAVWIAMAGSWKSH